MVIPQKLKTRLSARAKSLIEKLKKNDSPLHLLEKLYESQGSFASNFLHLEGVKSEDFVSVYKKIKKLAPKHKAQHTQAKTIERCLLTAARTASRAGHRLVSTQHILYALLLASSREGGLKEFFAYIGRSPKRLKGILEDIIFNDIMMASPTRWEDDFPHEHGGEVRHMQGQDRKTVMGARQVGSIVHDLVQKAKRNSLDPLIGRKGELERIIQILNRRTKRNPILVGDPGVGKTAIVYGLAQKIAKGHVPTSLREKSILSLNLSSLVAGTMFRGDFEGRLEAVLKEVKGKNSILFIDEIHNVVGAGSAMGTLDAANILKPALAGGEIQVIGSTTFEEYKMYIESDKALERRFQPIFVDEPTQEESVEILKGLKGQYEDYHGIRIHPRAIEAAVVLSERYLKDRFLPDKAIDVLDEACAIANISKSDSLEVRRLEMLKTKAAYLRKQKEEKTSQGLYEAAFSLKDKEENLLKKIETQERKLQKTTSPVVVNEKDVKRVITTMTGIPLEEITAQNSKQLENIEKELAEDVVGQNEAISLLAKTIRRSRAGLNAHSRPLGSFIFIGPSGVGKTELARILAKKLFGENAFVKLDMSEFMEPHSISRLIGAPAGYVGYGKGGELTEKVRHNPHTLVLFDEIEKAHPQIFNVLLQILEDGELSDAMGLEVDFKNTVVIMTSNLGTEKFFDTQGAIGFEEKGKEGKQYDHMKSEALSELKKYLRPELLNRIDDVIVFETLSFNHIQTIVDLQLKKLALHIKQEKNITIQYNKKIRDWLAEKSFDIKQGGRLVRRTIEREVGDWLASKIISGQLRQGQKAKLSLSGKELLVETKKRP